MNEQPTTPRRRAEKKEKEKDALQEKRIQIQPAVAKEVQTFINAKRKEARGMVLGRWGGGGGGLQGCDGLVLSRRSWYPLSLSRCMYRNMCVYQPPAGALRFGWLVGCVWVVVFRGSCGASLPVALSSQVLIV